VIAAAEPVPAVLLAVGVSGLLLSGVLFLRHSDLADKVAFAATAVLALALLVASAL
jgi:predicted membrane metal-binding protein